MKSRRPTVNRWSLLILPACIFLAAFFGYPLVLMAIRSFTDPSPANYAIFRDSPLYIRTLLTTFEISAIITLVCLVLGYPYAYVMNMVSPRGQAVLAAVVLLPFWSSMLVRTYSWTVWLQDSGVINSLLIDLGLIDEPLPLIRNLFGVSVAMAQILLPYMVLPIYAVMRRIDTELTPAAESLGASPFAAFRRVFFRLSLPGVYAGCLLVFVLSLGFYIAPALLGGPRNTMISQLIVDKVSLQLRFGEGSALAMVLLVITLLILAIGSRFASVGQVFGGEE